jgi:hypothetical protein
MSNHLHPVSLLDIPAPQPADLLEQLAQDHQTAGLAKLAQRLISALKIPMHSRASNDQSFGGVSDLTNRGNFDRLLLSELAHDDLSLMVRLANNEALYLRREELPANHNRQRFILIDTSIKMWGTPRLYALATALAAINTSKVIIHTFALQGSHFREINLTSPKGIKTTLNQLSPALDSADALTAFTKAFPLNRQQEYFLITDEQLFYTPSFQYAFANLRHAHGFLVTVSRAGQLQLFQYTGAGRRLLHSLLLDLPELLRVIQHPLTGLPAFFNVKAAPLYFPSNKIQHDQGHLYEAFGVTGITQDGRVLYCPDEKTGAREIIPNIIKGRYYFGNDGVSMIYILVHAQDTNKLTLYKIGTAALISKKIEYSHTIPANNIISIGYTGKEFLIDAGDLFYALNPEAKNTDVPLVEPYNDYADNRFYPGKIKRHINNGYSTINRAQQVCIRNGLLWINGKEITVYNEHLLLTDKTTSKIKAKISGEGPTIVAVPDADYRLMKFTFPDGSEVFVDSRGLLHLRSVNKNIQEVTILLVLSKPTACWASDGRVCGSAYFTGNNPNIIPVQEFYNKYIQPFISALS